ncbi:hypothetical protein [Streptomyces xanthophaeus]|uniref:hypothetical protein n=1 Tax=Streptomyces xanthophaeus TaxID=67385 RepID=UPI0038701AEB|nr:hypothetical protein OG264_37820 [Streptomyces xanthophaeus]WST58253.1 hypothetical protein OG605_00615 [Streptomyces xanthophaeus]
MSANVGRGRAEGQVKDSFRPFTSPLSSAPLPPPENAIDTAAALGITRPFASNCSPGSASTQPLPRLTRTVVLYRLTDHFPDGSAQVSDVSVR